MKLEMADIKSEDSVTSDEVDDSSTTTRSSYGTSLSHSALVTLDGIHSGVPTRTTSTLTPTTLRNIEQTFLELTNDTSNTIPCQAGFVPPLPQFEQEPQEHSLSSTGTNSSESWHTYQSKHDSLIDGNSSEATTEKSSNSKKNMGGRRPKNSSNLSPEEEEKRRVRRERNKLAAARCRKRRVDQTNDLLEKVAALEQEKSRLEREIQDLQGEKEDIEFVLETHLNQCKLVTTKAMDIKPKLEFKEPQPNPTNHIPMIDKIKVEVEDDFKVDPYDEGQPPAAKRVLMSTANPIMTNSSVMSPSIGGGKPNRPSSLNVPFQLPPSQTIGMAKNIADIAGVQITTPSNVVAFNFESLMDGGTGLTPVAQYATQNKTPLDLATPTSEPSKLVSL